MADLAEMISSLKEMQNETTDINSSLVRINKSYNDSIARLAKLSGTTTKLGAAWSVFSRLTVAIAPGIHKAEAAARSLFYVLKFVQVSREQAAESDQKNLKTIRTINEERENSLKLIKLMDKASEAKNQNMGHTMEMEVVYQNKQIKYLIDRLGFEKGIAEARARAMQVSETTFKIDEELSKVERNRLYDAQRFSEVRGMDINKVALALKHEEKLTELQDRRYDLNREMILSDPAKANVIKKQLEKIDADIAGQQLVTEEAKRRSGYSFLDTGEITRNPAAARDSPLKKLEEGFKSRLDGVQKFFEGPNLKILGSFIKSGALLFGKILLFITVLGLVVYLLHKLGVFEKLAEMFREGKFDAAIKMFQLAFEGIKMIVVGIAEFIVAIFKVFKALFTGEGLGKALGNLIEKTVLMLVKIVGGLILVAVGLLGGILATQITMFLAAVYALWDNIRVGLPTWMGGEGRNSDRAIERRVERGERRTKNYAEIGRNIGIPSTGFTGMADGGLVASGGIFKVGERGEELVVLPSGTRVFNNQQTRSMGNTINVSVNGRVGATEQELNDLARKLGEKINREMNRFGASGYRG
jgi:hypothetical protein